MNFTETFDQFSSKLTTTDLALYAGIGMVVWVMFKDKLSPVQKVIMQLVDRLKTLIGQKPADVVSVPTVPENMIVKDTIHRTDEDLFFKLVVSWKQTRDLAVLSGCKQAVEVADQMFPFLSPTVCGATADDTE